MKSKALTKLKEAMARRASNARKRAIAEKHFISEAVAPVPGAAGGAIAALVDSAIDDPQLGGTAGTVGQAGTVLGATVLGFVLRKSPMAARAAFHGAAGAAGAAGYALTQAWRNKAAG